MTETDLLAAIRLAVREELAALGRPGRRRRSPPVAADPWDARLAAWLAAGGIETDWRDRAFVDAGRALGAGLGVPPERWRGSGTRLAAALGRLGWMAGGRVRRGGRKVTPYYRAEEEGAF